MPQRCQAVDARLMVVDVLGALLFFVSFMVAWTMIDAVQARKIPPAE